MIPSHIHRVATFTRGGHHGALVGLAELDGDASAELRPTAEELAHLGLHAMVYVAPPRRDDCTRRLRTFTAQRELPLSSKAPLAAAVALGVTDTAHFEQGVIATEIARSDDINGVASWTLPVARPVINGRPVEDRALAASALGLDVSHLAQDLPVQSVSCGWLSVLVPVESVEALSRAKLDTVLWQRVIEKAKPVYAVAFVPSREGPVPMRCLVANASDDEGTGLAAASVTEWLTRFGVRPLDGRVTEVTQAQSRVRVALDGAIARITGTAKLVGEVTLDWR